MTVQEIERYMTGIRDERREAANTATRIGTAFLLLLHYLAGNDSPFLRKDMDDETKHLLTLAAGAVIGESSNIKLNPDGSIVCGSIQVNGSAIFNELVFNHQNVLEGDTYFTDKGIIESIEQTDLREYTLTFRKEYAEDCVTFQSNDILLGKVNNLDRDKTFYAFWLRVNTVDRENNTAQCTLYGDTDVEGGKNYPPAEAARVIRWGNTVNKERQSVWFVSSKDGRWLFLQGVDRPKLEDSENGSNYSAFIGLPPRLAAIEDLIDKGVISEHEPAIYGKNIIAQNFIKVDYKGAPVYQARDCGQWNASQKYIHDFDEAEQGYYADRVWWGGCYWECSAKSCANSEPRYGNTDWTCLMGGKNFSIRILSSAGNFFRAGSSWQTTLTAFVKNADMDLYEKDLKNCTIVWLRSSTDTEGDKAWNKQHDSVHSLSIDITSDTDVPAPWVVGSEVAFQINIIFLDGSNIDWAYTIRN